MVRFSWIFVVVMITYGFGISNQATFQRNINYSDHKIYFPGPMNRPDTNKYYHTTTVTSKPFTTTSKPQTPAPSKPPNSYDVRGDEESCVLTATPPDPESECCGIEATSNNFIVGGDATSLEQYPWLVAIEYRKKRDNKTRAYCGGFLISGRYVLSAAHCFAGEIEEIAVPVNILLGDYNITNEGPDCIKTKSGANVCNKGAIRVPLENVIVHPDHYHDTHVSYHDIAIVRLSQTVEYSNYVRPICLPTTDITVAPPENLVLYTAGWGAIRQYWTQFGFDGVYEGIKRYVALPYRDNTVCKNAFGSFVGQGHMCAGGEKGKDSCRGDSGGPLMRESDGVFTVDGMVSAGSGVNKCGTEGLPGLYTKIHEYLQWIRANIKP